jgi:glycosyltransferase involved in cell wall biosynthesis
MRLAYFSPLPPQGSGIADYSCELLPYLSTYADVDLWVEGYDPANDSLLPFRIINYSGRNELLPQLADYDGIVYHLGNNVRYHQHIYQVFLQFPGVVVLHDFALHHFFAGYFLEVLKSPQGYIDEMEYNYGPHGRSLAEEILAGRRAPLWLVEPLRYPINKRILDRARGLIVHSEFVRRLVQRTHPTLPIRMIHLPTSVMDDLEHPNRVKAAYEIPGDKLLLASFGHATAAKRLDAVLRAISRLPRKDFLYLLVGESGPEVTSEVHRVGLSDVVRMMGHVDPESFTNCLRIIDICVNLRSPTLGETSGAVCRALGVGKPCIVSNVGWFAELPGDCVAKVDADETEDDLLLACLTALLENEPLRRRMGQNARRYIREHYSPETAAKEYIEFVESLQPSTRSQRRDGGLVAEISLSMADLGVSEYDDSLIQTISLEIVPFLSRDVSSSAP